MNDKLRCPILNSNRMKWSLHNKVNIDRFETNCIVDPRNDRQSIKSAVNVSQTDEELLEKINKTQ